MKYNNDLIIRFGQFIVQSGNAHDGINLMSAAKNNSAVVGGRIKLALKNTAIDETVLHNEFTKDELSEIFEIPETLTPDYDYTKRERTANRQSQLNSMAQELGFDGLSQMLTAWKNGEIKITVTV